MTAHDRQDKVWQATSLTDTYLEGVRAAIPFAAEQIDIIVRLSRAARPQARAILDLGCGDGILGHALLDEFADNAPQAVLADFSPPMLDAARVRLSDYEGYFIEVDYAQPEWVTLVTRPLRGNGEAFDVVVSGFSIHHQPDERKREIYQEIYSILAPGGIFLNLEHVASASRWGEIQFEEYFIDSLHRYHGPRGKAREQVLDIEGGKAKRHELGRELINRVEMAARTAGKCQEKREKRGLSPVERFDAAVRSRSAVLSDRADLPACGVASP